MTNTISMTENNSVNSTNFEKLNKFKKFLSSNYCLVVLSAIIVLSWAINFVYLSTIVLFGYIVCHFIFNKESPVGLIFPVLCIFYMSPNTENTVLFMAICGALCFTFIVGFVIRQIYITKEVKPKKGKMFWAFVLYLIASLLAGVIGYFNFVNFLITLAFVLFIYAFYWFCINFLKKDFKKYFAYSLVFLTLIITAQLVISYLRAEDILLMLNKKLVRVGTGEINGAAMFMCCGVVACFYLAYKNKFDYLYILLALFYNVAIFFTYSRIAIAVSVVLSLVLLVFVLIKSPNKKLLLISIGVLIALVILFCIVFFDKVYNLLAYYLGKGFSGNGRDQLWSWCWEQFKSSPIFGVGYITKDSYALGRLDGAGLTDVGGFSLIYTHNTILHYLTCTGVVGLILNLPYLLKRYYLTLKNTNAFKIFCLFGLVAIEICGLFDSNPTFNPLVILLIVMFTAFAEIEVKPELQAEKVDKQLEQNNKKLKEAENMQLQANQESKQENNNKPKPKNRKIEQKKQTSKLKENA